MCDVEVKHLGKDYLYKINKDGANYTLLTLKIRVQQKVFKVHGKISCTIINLG